MRPVIVKAPAEVATPRCSKQVWGRVHSSPCARNGVVDRDGRWFCKQHDPVARKQKQEAHSAELHARWAREHARWAREDAEQKRARRIAQAERHVIEQARLWQSGESGGDMRLLGDAVRALEEASLPAERQEGGND